MLGPALRGLMVPRVDPDINKSCETSGKITEGGAVGASATNACLSIWRDQANSIYLSKIKTTFQERESGMQTIGSASAVSLGK